jgi:neopullulanase
LEAYPASEGERDWRRTQRSLEEYGYRSWWDLPALPKFNTDTEAVRQFILEVARHWIEFGVDGWRLDVPQEIEDDEFWRDFRRVVKQANPEAYIVGEIWFNANRWLQGDQFDAVMNYIFDRACLGFFGGENLDVTQCPGGYELRRLRATEFADEIDDLLDLYDWQVSQVQLNLLDSHDMPRFLTLVQGDKDALRLATLFQMTFPGAPCIYYGDEIGMEGWHDPDCRRAFPWDQSRWDQDLLAFFRRAIALRHSYPALRRGRYVRLHADDQHKVYAFARQAEQQTLVVVLNNGPERYDLDLPVRGLFVNGALLRDVWGDSEAQVVDGRITRGTLEPRSGAVLTEQPRDGQAGAG